MRTTVNLDERLIEQASRLTGLTDRNSLLQEALTTLVRRESARRLARLAGSDPGIQPIPRRRPRNRH
jgi:Arc/MetJ family transcription regulator